MKGRASALQREIRQKRPFGSRCQESAIGLLRTADVVRRQIAAIVEPHGLTLQQYNVLRILRGAGAEGLPTLEIAERMIEQAPGITRLMDRLEAKGLVRRRRCDADRRQVLCWITEAGLELLRGLDQPMQDADEAILGNLAPRKVATLIRILDEVRSGLNAPPSSQSKGD
jgi:DNA-binding MarR family transcriptional regulator